MGDGLLERGMVLARIGQAMAAVQSGYGGVLVIQGPGAPDVHVRLYTQKTGAAIYWRPGLTGCVSWPSGACPPAG